MDIRVTTNQHIILSALHEGDMTAAELLTSYLPSLDRIRIQEICRRLVTMKLIWQDATNSKYSLTPQGQRIETAVVDQVRYVACHAVERRRETIHLRCVSEAGPPITLCGCAVRTKASGSPDPRMAELGRPYDLPYLLPYSWGCDSDWCADCTDKAQKMGLIPGREAMSE